VRSGGKSEVTCHSLHETQQHAFVAPEIHDRFSDESSRVDRPEYENPNGRAHQLRCRSGLDARVHVRPSTFYVSLHQCRNKHRAEAQSPKSAGQHVDEPVLFVHGLFVSRDLGSEVRFEAPSPLREAAVVEKLEEVAPVKNSIHELIVTRLYGELFDKLERGQLVQLRPHADEVAPVLEAKQLVLESLLASRVPYRLANDLGTKELGRAFRVGSVGITHAACAQSHAQYPAREDDVEKEVHFSVDAECQDSRESEKQYVSC
jgi:hypothetical protein